MIRKLILSLCVGFCCLACEEALPDYNTTWSGVQFVLGQTLNPERFSYSFIGKEDTRMMDTLWLPYDRKDCYRKEVAGLDWSNMKERNGNIFMGRMVRLRILYYEFFPIRQKREYTM